MVWPEAQTESKEIPTKDNKQECLHLCSPHSTVAGREKRPQELNRNTLVGKWRNKGRNPGSSNLTSLWLKNKATCPHKGQWPVLLLLSWRGCFMEWNSHSTFTRDESGNECTVTQKLCPLWMDGPFAMSHSESYFYYLRLARILMAWVEEDCGGG